MARPFLLLVRLASILSVVFLSWADFVSLFGYFTLVPTSSPSHMTSKREKTYADSEAHIPDGSPILIRTYHRRDPLVFGGTYFPIKTSIKYVTTTLENIAVALFNPKGVTVY